MISLPAGPLLFDTGIYIRFSRGENHFWLGDDARVRQRTLLTVVVAAELIALEAARARATLVTENAKDFAHWRSLLASAGKTLKIFKPS
jgi:hypothetical protein